MTRNNAEFEKRFRDVLDNGLSSQQLGFEFR
jgi:hypothetical protein